MSVSRTSRVGRGAAALVVAQLAFSAPDWAGATDPAKDSSEVAGTYSGVASADAYRLRYAITNFLIIEDFVDGGGPSSQAALDSLGDSTGFASFPYPGQTGTTLLGVVSTLTGKPMPSYPFIASSQYPSSPERDIQQPGYRLHSESNDVASRAFADAGNQDTAGNEIGGFSRASVEALKGGGVASRSAATTHLRLNALRISGVSASSQLVRDATGKVTRSSSLVVSGMEIGGIPIAVTDRGLVVGSQQVPLGVVGQVAQSVSQQGVTVKYVPAVQTEDSVMSAGLEISVVQPVPNTAAAKQVVTVTLGRAFARGASAAFDLGLFPIDLGLPSTPELPVATPVSGGVPVLGEPPAAGLGTGLTPDLGTGPAPVTEPSGSGQAAGSGPRYVAVAAELPSLSLYPILALGGLVLLGSTVAVRRQSRASI